MSFRRVLRRRWWVVVPVVLVVLAVVVVGGAAFAFPNVAATTCPTCFGLQQIAPNVYTEPGLTVTQQEHVSDTIREAETRVATFYRGRESSPTILACVTPACYRHIGGGGEKGIGVLNRAVMLSPDGVNTVIAAHEMSHVELHQRLGEARGQVPQWFDEGLAVVVSNDPRYLAPDTTADRCLARPTGPLPTTLRAWLDEATADPQAYAKAAREVSRWLATNGGPSAVLTLVARLRAGEQLSQLVKGYGG